LTASSAAFYHAGVTRQRNCPQVHARTSHARFLVFLFALAAHPVSAADPQVILLKRDPVANRAGGGPTPPRWQKVADCVKANNIKGSFGIIRQSLEASRSTAPITGAHARPAPRYVSRRRSRARRRLPLNPKAASQEVLSWHFPAVC
jgi:hypothetical protein